MAKKIDVWAHLHSHRGEWFVDEIPHETKVAGTQKASTLVIHGDKHEPVYTASEVRAMLKEIVDAREAVRNSPEGMVWATPRQDIEVIASKHGINIADVAIPKADHA